MVPYVRCLNDCPTISLQKDLMVIVSSFLFVWLMLCLDGMQDITFQQHLMATRRSLLAAVEHSDVPFTKMVELAEVNPSQSHTPVFQAVVSFKEYSAIARESSDQGVSFNPFMIEVRVLPDEVNAAAVFEPHSQCMWHWRTPL